MTARSHSKTPDNVAAAASTRAALLQAATSVFAAQGYDLARVREIAELAGANVAAISYHFGSKQALYSEVLRQQASERIERYPFPDPAPTAGDDVALRAAIDMLLGRFLAADQRSVVPKLLMREFMTPTPALAALIRDVIGPQFRQLHGVVAALLGPKATAEATIPCTFSVVSQCMFYLFARPLVEELAPQTYDADAVERLAAHITQFSLGALQAQRQRLEGGHA